VVNASDAMPNGGKLFVETSHEEVDEDAATENPEIGVGRYAVLTVRDTGMGMSEDVLEHIFEPFFTTKGVDEGTGLGLSTTFGIVKQSEGHIFVESEIEVGSKFQIYLPTVDDPVSTIEESELDDDLLPGSERILLVEDEQLVRSTISVMLEQLGYHVSVASNGEEALRLILANDRTEFDILLTDIIMPLMGGPDLVKIVSSSHPEIKILFMSGYADVSVETQIANDKSEFIRKPITILQLATKLRQVLAQRA